MCTRSKSSILPQLPALGISICLIFQKSTWNILDSLVKIWDLRHMRSELIALEHSRSVRSAQFSPETGQQVLTTSFEDTINIWHHAKGSHMTHFDRRLKMRHNNQTGRWLAPFAAVWHPRTEGFFICGSLESVRRVKSGLKLEQTGIIGFCLAYVLFLKLRLCFRWKFSIVKDTPKCNFGTCRQSAPWLVSTQISTWPSVSTRPHFCTFGSRERNNLELCRMIIASFL